MLSYGFHQTVAPKARILNVIWGAFLAACLFYVVIAWIMFGQAGSRDGTVGEPMASGTTLTVLFAIMATGLLGASVVVERVLLAPSRLESMVRQAPLSAFVSAFDKESDATPGTEQGPIPERLSDTEQRLVGLSVPFLTAHIVIWSLRESIVVLGLVLAILEARFQAILPFAGVGFLALLLKVPRPVSFFERQLALVRKIT